MTDPQPAGTSLTERARTLLALGRTEAAVAEARRAVAAEPGDPDALVVLAMALLDLHRGEEAEQVAVAAQRAAPDAYSVCVVSTRSAMVLAHRNRGREGRRWTAVAQERADRLREFALHEPHAAYILSRARTTARRWSEAAEAADLASRAAPATIWGPLARAELALARHRRRAARVHVAEALRRDPEHPYVRRIGALVASGRRDRVRHLRAAARAGDRRAGGEAADLLAHLARPHAPVWPTILIALFLLGACSESRGPWEVYLTLLVVGWAAVWFASHRLRRHVLADLAPSARAILLRPRVTSTVGAVVGCVLVAMGCFANGWPVTWEAAVEQAEQDADRAQLRADLVPVVITDPSGRQTVRHVRPRPEPDVPEAYAERAYLTGAAGVFLLVGVGTVVDAVAPRRLARRRGH